MQFKTAHISEHSFVFSDTGKQTLEYTKKKRKGKKLQMPQAEVGPELLTFTEGCVYLTQKRHLRQNLERISQAGGSPLLPEYFLELTLFFLLLLDLGFGEIYSSFLCSLGHYKGARCFGTLHSFYFKLILTGFQVIFVIGSSLLCSKD